MPKVIVNRQKHKPEHQLIALAAANAWSLASRVTGMRPHPVSEPKNSSWPQAATDWEFTITLIKGIFREEISAKRVEHIGILWLLSYFSSQLPSMQWMI